MPRDGNKSPGRAKPSGRESDRPRGNKSPGRHKSPGRGRAEEKPLSKKRQRWQKEHAPEDEEEAEDTMTVPAALQRKIAKEAQQQQDEEYLASFGKGSSTAQSAAGGGSGASASSAFRHSKMSAGDDSDEDDDAGNDDGYQDADDDDELEGAGEYFDHEEVEELELGEDDQRAMDTFFGRASASQQTLADVIMAKIQEKEAAAAAAGHAIGGEGSGSGRGPMGDDDEIVPDLPPKVIEVYTGVGKLLSSYRSGKLPKAFKIVPKLANWEEVLYATDPDGWSPAATCAATKLFASSFNQKMAQRFYNLILLPAVQVSRHAPQSERIPPPPAPFCRRCFLRAPRLPTPLAHAHVTGNGSAIPMGGLRVLFMRGRAAFGGHGFRAPEPPPPAAVPPPQKIRYHGPPS